MKLAAVLRYTAKLFNPGWTVDVRKLQPTRLQSKSGSQSFADNHYKLAEWERVVREAPDGERLLLVDADTFVTGALDSLWDLDFSVAYTYRRSVERFPLNGGVVAVRVGAEARRFFAAWLAKDEALFYDEAAHEPLRRKYGGMNQSSLGALLDAGEFALLPIPCEVWNCEDTSWSVFDPERTKLVHVKSALRLAVFDIAINDAVRRLAKLWKKYAKDAATHIENGILKE